MSSFEDHQLLFAKVADLDAAERLRYFEEHRVSEEVRAEIESLLRYDRDSASALRNTVGGAVEQFLDAVPQTMCGPYQLVRLLGSGGTGSVYLGQRKDGEIDLRAAIKLLHETDARRTFRERFLQERQILASLNHPGIARLLDVGHTDRGQPYLVMEYVDGVPIDEYCKGARVDDTLRLFLRLCDVIAYLHRNLVIHRDLKPSNVLVSADGSPKILDFGIAKIVDDDIDIEVTRERIFTLDYASPEQVRGSAKTTATDVYSLGATLYGVLAGRSPHRSTHNESIEEAIGSVDPAPLYELDPSLPRDLSYVVQKALRKEPAERYPTVDAFADDLRAILAYRPVNARSGELWYKARKFARRNWIPASALAAVMLSLGGGLYVANRERAAAQKRFGQLRQLSDRVLKFDNDIRELPGSTKAREKIVSVSMEYLDGLRSDARDNIDLKLDVANGFRAAAEIEGVPIVPSLGHLKEADATLAKAAALAESALASGRDTVEALQLAGDIEADRMIVASTRQDWTAALEHANRAMVYEDRIATNPALRGDQRLQLARLYLNTGQAEMNMHRYPDAIALFHRGIDCVRGSPGWAGPTAQGLSALANAQRQTGDLEAALVSINEARALSETLSFPNEMLRASALYAILWRQGLILGEDESVSLGRPAEAIAPLQQAFDLVDRQAAKDPDDFSFRDRVATAGQQLGDVLRHSDPARALAVYERTLARLGEVKNNPSARRREAVILAHASYPLHILHRTAEARGRVEESFAVLRAIGMNPANGVTPGGEWDNAMRASANLDSETGNPGRARSTLLDLEQKVMASHPSPETDIRHANDLSRLYASIVAVDRKLGLKTETEKYQRSRRDLWNVWYRRLPRSSFVRRQMELAVRDLPSNSAK